MSNGFLSQEEIDSLLNGGNDVEDKSTEDKEPAAAEGDEESDILSDLEKDLLGEIGNISMGSASTALSTIINQQVNITTPVVSVTSLKKMQGSFEVPNFALEVGYTSGIVGENLLVMNIKDAGIIASLMMGGDGKVDMSELSEIEQSAVSEAMNQMIGSAATSMATMFSREINISPPVSKIWDDSTSPLSKGLTDDEPIVRVSFRLTIGDLVDSHIMQILPIETAKKIVAIMMGQETEDAGSAANNVAQSNPTENLKIENNSNNQEKIQYKEPEEYTYSQPVQNIAMPHPTQPVNVQQAQFRPLTANNNVVPPRNLDLIMDVPLEISVVLGKTKKNVKDILALNTGSLVELDKLAEEPVEILVNGKKIAFGEVVVVDENFGVRITSIVSNTDRINSLR